MKNLTVIFVKCFWFGFNILSKFLGLDQLVTGENDVSSGGSQSSWGKPNKSGSMHGNLNEILAFILFAIFSVYLACFIEYFILYSDRACFSQDLFLHVFIKNIHISFKR